MKKILKSELEEEEGKCLGSEEKEWVWSQSRETLPISWTENSDRNCWNKRREGPLGQGRTRNLRKGSTRSWGASRIPNPSFVQRVLMGKLPCGGLRAALQEPGWHCHSHGDILERWPCLGTSAGPQEGKDIASICSSLRMWPLSWGPEHPSCRACASATDRQERTFHLLP